VSGKECAVKRLLPVLLAVLLAGLFGCDSTPTPAAPLSPEQEKKFEEELQKKRAEEARGERGGQ
jgi:hypothetical protein